MDATVIITRYKEPNNILNDTLYSLAEQTNCKLDIVMLDQFENKETIELCKKLNAKQNLHTFQYQVIKPISLSYARNLGIKESVNDIVICIDPDAIASSNRASSIIDCYNAYSNTWIVWTKILPKWNWKRNVFLYSSFFWADYSMLDLWDWIMQKVTKVIWASFSVHKWRLWTLEYFDENLGRKNGNLIWWEETDLCRRAIDSWIDVTYTGKWYILHQVSADRLKYNWIIKRVFRWGFSRSLSRRSPQPHRIKRSLIDYLLLPVYLSIYLSWFLFQRVSFALSKLRVY
jgi:GT2 family glycosyltransferase